MADCFIKCWIEDLEGNVIALVTQCPGAFLEGLKIITWYSSEDSHYPDRDSNCVLYLYESGTLPLRQNAQCVGVQEWANGGAVG